MDRHFNAVSAITKSGADAFQTTISPRWTTNGGKPHGGYLLATMARAAMAGSEHEHVLAISGHYLRSAEVGPAELRVEVLRAGRTLSTLRVELVQSASTRVVALATVGSLGADPTPYWAAGAPDPGTSDWNSSVRVTSPTPSGINRPVMEQIDLRLDVGSLGIVTGQPTGRGELRGWLDFIGDEAFDPVSLVFAVDAFPPATLDFADSGWVPTVELTAYVRGLPAPGPVRVLQRVQTVSGGRFDQVCFVWDSTGRLVAHSTQLALTRLQRCHPTADGASHEPSFNSGS